MTVEKLQKMNFWTVILCALTVLIGLGEPTTVLKAIEDDWFPLTIIHLNDMHARFEETNLKSNSCDPEKEVCIGGYARVVTKVKELLVTKASKNPIYLNAGDNFQGTLWYNIGRWNVTAQFLNMLKADAMTIGNHEFDHDVEGVVPFLEHIESPIVIANVDDSQEPTFQKKYVKSIVIDKYERKIGVIGAILQTTNTIAKTGKLRFTDEVQAVKEEAEKLKEEGIDIIVVLTHCGIERDREIARMAGPNIDIIVGGHSHSFLFSGDNLPSLDKPADTYPVVETQEDGHRVLVVQASAYTKYVGEITLYFDDKGIVQDWEGEPIFMGPEIVPDAEVLREIQPWKEIIDISGKRVVGSLKITASGTSCYQRECLMGSLQAESMVFAMHDYESEDDGWTYATIAMTNPGGVRGTLSPGDLTYSDLVTTTPFENTVDSMELEGKYIRQALEHSARFDSPSILQVAGLRIVFDMKKPAYSRIVKLDALCRLCEVPRYEPLQDNRFYRIVVNNFLLVNGDNFAMIRDNGKNHVIRAVDIDVLVNYVEKNSPISLLNPRGRITFV